MLGKVILDNTVLNISIAIKSFDFFDRIAAFSMQPFLIPEEIFQEANKPAFHKKNPEKIANLLAEVEAGTGRIILCTSVDELLLSELKTIIDQGEAEAIAQAEKISSNTFISDDSKAIKRLLQFKKSSKGSLVSPSFQMFSSFYLLALLHISALITDHEYESAKAEMYGIRKWEKMRLGRQNDYFKTLCVEYTQAAILMGVNISQNDIATNCKVNFPPLVG